MPVHARAILAKFKHSNLRVPVQRCILDKFAHVRKVERNDIFDIYNGLQLEWTHGEPVLTTRDIEQQHAALVAGHTSEVQNSTTTVTKPRTLTDAIIRSPDHAYLTSPLVTCRYLDPEAMLSSAAVCCRRPS